MARILIVEDDRQLSSVIVDFLHGEGHHVDAAYKGPDGMQKLFAAQYDLVILDWELPHLSGPEICQQYRAAGGQAHVIMLTGKKAVEDKEAGLDAGADDYLTKPFHLKELAARIRASLRRLDSTGGQQSGTISDGSIQPGLIIAGKYRLEKFIAQGGMALVYRANHLGMNKPVVVKLLHEHLIDRPQQRSRFERECLTMARINHVNVATVFDTGMTEWGRPYLVMEHVGGESLADLIEREAPLPLSDAAMILYQCCLGLEEVHAAGIIHRDLKPENILLQERKDRSDWVKIVDFGIAHLIDSNRRLTEPEKVVGSVGYMAPEQMMDEPLDCRTDIYALGVILFLMLTNYFPFKAANTDAMFHRQITETPDPLSDYLPELALGPLVNMIIRKALERKPENRYQTVAELRIAIEYVLAKTI